MRWIAVSVVAWCLAVSLAALAWVDITGGEDDQPPEAQASPQAQTPSPWQPASPALIGRMQLDRRLWPRQSRFASGWPPLVEARVVDDTIRYVLKSEFPATFLKHAMTVFLWNFRFGVKGRPMVVRLLDGEGRFAWAAAYDGVQKMAVRARPGLVRCGSIWNGERRLPHAPGAQDGPRCPVEPERMRAASTVTVLR